MTRSADAAEDMRGELCGKVARCDALQALPRRHGVHLEHQQPPILVLDQVDAGVIGADCRRRGDALRREIAGGGDRLAARAAAHIGDPTAAVAEHGGDGLAADHHDAEVAPALVASDEALQVVHARILLRRRPRLALAEAPEAAPLRAEQRLPPGPRRRARAPTLPPPRALAGPRRR